MHKCNEFSLVLKTFIALEPHPNIHRTRGGWGGIRSEYHGCIWLPHVWHVYIPIFSWHSPMCSWILGTFTQHFLVYTHMVPSWFHPEKNPRNNHVFQQILFQNRGFTKVFPPIHRTPSLCFSRYLRAISAPVDEAAIAAASQRGPLQGVGVAAGHAAEEGIDLGAPLLSASTGRKVGWGWLRYL